MFNLMVEAVATGAGWEDTEAALFIISQFLANLLPLVSSNKNVYLRTFEFQFVYETVPVIFLTDCTQHRYGKKHIYNSARRIRSCRTS